MTNHHEALPSAVNAASPDRSFNDSYVWALSLGLACYAIMGKGFAYLGIPPLFIGEVLFCAGVFAFFRTGCLASVLAASSNLLLLALAIWALARTIPFVSVHGTDALRDAVVVLYGGFAFITCALLMERPERLNRCIRLFGRFAAFYGAAAGLLYTLQVVLGNRDLVPSWPASGTPILFLKAGDVAVHLAGTAAFAILFFRRFSWIWTALLLGGMALVGVASRGGLLGMAIAVVLAATFCGSARIRQISGVLVVGGAVLATVWIIDLNISMSNFDSSVERDRQLSVEQLAQNVLSIFGGETRGDLTATKAWRLAWWNTIEDYTVHGDYFWSGKGFGINLSVADGIVDTPSLDGPELRSPHSVNMTILARMGIPGLILWTLLLLSWFLTMASNLVMAHLRRDEAWFRLFLFLTCYVAAVVIDASFDVALEGPMLGIWFWALFGFGIGTAQIYRTHRMLQPHQHSWRSAHGQMLYQGADMPRPYTTPPDTRPRS